MVAQFIRVYWFTGLLQGGIGDDVGTKEEVRMSLTIVMAGSEEQIPLNSVPGMISYLM